MRKESNTKSRIVTAAWKLFYEHGYENTTIDDIVEESCSSKGSFYHYFTGKDALTASLPYLFDEKYEELSKIMNPDMSAIDKLVYMNQEVFLMIENTVSVDLLKRSMAAQLTANEKGLLDAGRTYYKLMRKVIQEGQKEGFFAGQTINDISHAYAMFERALMYDWCISDGSYSLSQYSGTILPGFLLSLCRK